MGCQIGAFIILQALSELPISEDENGEDSLEQVLTLAREYHLSAYDGVYLELALRKNSPLATLDKSLQKAAHQTHVRIL